MAEPGRCQLDRERDPIDRAADSDNVWAARPVQHEARLGELRPVDEELHGVGARASHRLARKERIGQGERWHTPNELALDVERLAAGREQAGPGAGAEKADGELRRRIEHVLAVVQ